MVTLWIVATAMVLAVGSPPSGESHARDEEAIRGLASEFARAWNAGDPAAMAALWTEDGDFIQPAGRKTQGRSEIEKRLAEEYSYFYKGSHFSSTVDSVRFLKPDVAILDGAWETVGAHTPKGGPLPPLKGLYTLIVVKKAGRWHVASSRTMIPARPPGT